VQKSNRWLGVFKDESTKESECNKGTIAVTENLLASAA